MIDIEKDNIEGTTMGFAMSRMSAPSFSIAAPGEYKVPIKTKKLTETATIPTRGSDQAAGYDLYADLEDGEITIAPGETIGISTGIAIQLPPGHFGGIFARSGLAIKKGLRPANAVGVIDSDYRGDVIVALHNDSKEEQVINHGDRIAQLILLSYSAMNFTEVEELDETERNDQGFGSTGM